MFTGNSQLLYISYVILFILYALSISIQNDYLSSFDSCHTIPLVNLSYIAVTTLGPSSSNGRTFGGHKSGRFCILHY